MKLIDKILLGAHNIKNNKSRSILTVIIVYLMSFVIMFLLFIGVSFSTNINRINKQYIQESLDYVSTTYQNYQEKENNYFDKNVYPNVEKVLDKNKEIVSFIKYEVKGNNLFLTTYGYSLDQIIDIEQGTLPSIQSRNTNDVLVSKSFVDKYYETNGITLDVDSHFIYSFAYFDSSKDQNISYDFDLKVKGIYKVKEGTYKTSSSEKEIIISTNVDIIIDVDYIFSNVDNFKIQQANFYTSTSSEISYSKFINKNKKMVKDLTSVLPKILVGNNKEQSVYNFTLEEMRIYSTISNIVIGVLVFNCIILILLSVGSLSNTIVMSVNKNKKFIGLLKALGIQEKDLSSVICIEGIMIIVVGILLSFITLVCCRGLFIGINKSLINSVASFFVTDMEYKIVFITPFYIPLIVIVFFLLFTYIFSKSSITKIAKQDPISVINEVA